MTTPEPDATFEACKYNMSILAPALAHLYYCAVGVRLSPGPQDSASVRKVGRQRTGRLDDAKSVLRCMDWERWTGLAEMADYKIIHTENDFTVHNSSLLTPILTHLYYCGGRARLTPQDSAQERAILALSQRCYRSGSSCIFCGILLKRDNSLDVYACTVAVPQASERRLPGRSHGVTIMSVLLLVVKIKCVSLLYRQRLVNASVPEIRIYCG